MQICYRCEEKTNGLLEKIAKKNGISKNHLIDEIIKDYLYQNPYRLPDFHNVHTEKTILSGIQYTNEQLAQILEELNNLQSYLKSKDACTLVNSFEFFRIYAIQILLTIAKNLETINKSFQPSDRK